MKRKTGLMLAVLFTAWLSVDSYAATLTVEIKTGEVVEWTTYSRTSPVCGLFGCLVIHYDTCHQSGVKYITKYIEIEWKGEIKTLELERTEADTKEELRQDVLCEHSF